MNVYIYEADIFCEDCGEAIRKQRICEGFAPENPDDESSYDSDDFPKGPYLDGGGICDSPQHCGNGSDCLNAEIFDELSKDHKIGAWLENDLTPDGIEYVREAIREGGGVAEMWANFYQDRM